MTCDVWDVVVVPFPFSERPGTKRRPALVLSRSVFNKAGHSVLAMITTRARRPWPADVEITNFGQAGLHLPCIVRLKLFTLDNRLLLKRIGTLAAADRREVTSAVRAALV
ncbi:MAG TPA: type II toxin-antitoxin system PemK/MazF family toxin [Thermoanaerobaculia bacterium]|nr:type II toxin-antitoxin system PemK/MazF family toxin [Thermoanaerobaculia bacterium]